MKKYVGIWLNRREAIVVSLTKAHTPFSDKPAMIERIESAVERRVRPSGGSRSRKTPYGPQEISVESKQDAHIRHQLSAYHEVIISRISDADRILIFGPGQAKIQLKKEIEKSADLAKRIQKIESADKMTHKQIAAKVKKFFESYL